MSKHVASKELPSWGRRAWQRIFTLIEFELAFSEAADAKSKKIESSLFKESVTLGTGSFPGAGCG